MRIGPEAQPARLEDRLAPREARALARARELDDQDRVLRGEPDEHDQADLREQVVVLAADRDAEHREQMHIGRSG
jgi:hypothetical protein